MFGNLIKNTGKRFFSVKKTLEVIGIDFGSSYIKAAIVEGGQAKIIENNEGFRTTPSVVAINKDNEKLIGSAAKRQAVKNQADTFFGIRRLLGKRFDDPELQKELCQFGFKVYPHENGEAWIETSQGQQYSPPQIASLLLSKIKESVEGALNKTITETVITIPTYFNESQKQALKEAVKFSGLKARRLLTDPVAACFAYGLEKAENRTVFVYDIGGDSFDASVFIVRNGVFEMQGFTRSPGLGGDEIDSIITRHLVAEFKSQTKIDISNDKLALQRVIEAAEKSKIELSTLIQSDINLPYLAANEFGPQHLSYILTRAKLDSLMDGLLAKTIKSCEECLVKAALGKEQIDEVLLIGGMGKILKVQSIVESYFGKTVSKNPSPDEAVAIGAALYASILEGETENVVLIDIAPLSFGIETVGGLFIKIIPKGSPIPAIKKFVIGTASNNQSNINLKIYQGEREIASQNLLLGEFNIRGILPAQRSKCEIEITMAINQSGMINVMAKEIIGKKEHSFSIKTNLDFSEKEIEGILATSNRSLVEDQFKKESITKRLELDLNLHELEDLIETPGYWPSDKDLKEIEQVRKSLATENYNNFEQLKADIKNSIARISEQIKKEKLSNENGKSQQTKMDTKKGNEENKKSTREKSN